MSYLKENQYVNSSNYRARIYLHYRFSTNKNPWPRWVFDSFLTDEPSTVLEIGCGNGMLWKTNADRIPSCWNITLTDFSEGMLDDARKNIGESAGNITYNVMDAGSIPHDDRTFDIILANHMLYHIPDMRKVFSEIARVLKNDGVFYATTMEQDYMKEMGGIIREFRSLPPGGKSANSVIENFSLENGKELLNEYFRSVDLKIYENSLSISEATPLTDYALSLNSITPGRVVLDEREKNRFNEFLRMKIQKEGDISISANAGVFVCHIR